MNVPLSANILEVEDILKGLPDEALMSEAQGPTGNFPQYLVISEIQRRSDMRNRFAAEQSQPEPTVRDQIVGQGLGGMAAANQPPVAPGAMPPGGMPPGAMPPDAMMPPPEVVSDPSQTMYAAEGGLVDVNQDDAAIRLMNDLIGFRNRIPYSGDLYASREDPITEASLYGESIPNAILEDATKFDPELSLGMSEEDLSFIQGTGVDLPEVLSYSGGGIVELQEGGPPEDAPLSEDEQGGYFSGDQGWIPDWIEENPGKTAIAAADAAALGLMFAPEPFVSKAAAGILKAGTTAARFIPRLFGARRLSNLPRAEQVARLGRHGYAGRAERLRAGTAVDRAARARAIARAQTRLGLRGTAGLGILGATNYGAFFGGDDAETGGGGEMTPEQLAAWREEQERLRQEGLENNESIEPEAGSDEWIRKQLINRFDDKSSRYSQAVDEVMSEREERAALTERQAQSDMLSSMLMNLGAGTMSGDPGEGMRLAADAVNRIRETSGRDVVEQERLTQQLRLEGIDTEVAEEAALLTSLLEMNTLDAQARRDNNAELTNVLDIISTQIDAMASAAMARGETVTQDMMLQERARMYRQAAERYGYGDIFAGVGASFAPGSSFSVEAVN